jgi:hypothetical protein
MEGNALPTPCGRCDHRGQRLNRPPAAPRNCIQGTVEAPLSVGFVPHQASEQLLARE